MTNVWKPFSSNLNISKPKTYLANQTTYENYKTDELKPKKTKTNLHEGKKLKEDWNQHWTNLLIRKQYGYPTSESN